MICVPGTNGQRELVKPWPLLPNRFFIDCDEPWTIEGPTGVWVMPEKIQEAQQAQECKPAKEDPGGNWGTPRGGYQLSLRLEKQAFAPSEAINATVIFRNVGDQQLRAPANMPRFDTEVVLTNKKGEAVRPIAEEALEGLSSFQRRLRNVVQSPKFSNIMPKTQVKKQVRINELFRLSASEVYHLQVRYRTGVGTERITVSSGRASFKTVDK